MLSMLEIWVCSLKDQTFSLFKRHHIHLPISICWVRGVPLSIESWKILVGIGAISAAYSFRNHGGMASGPEALFVLCNSIDPVTPGTFCKKCVFWTFWWFLGWVSANLALLRSKVRLQDSSLPFLPPASRFSAL